MDTFGVIVGLLFVIIPVVMEIIAAALKKAGKEGTAAKVEKVREMLLSEEQKKEEAVKKAKKVKAEVHIPKHESIQPQPVSASVHRNDIYDAPFDSFLAGDITESSIKETVETVSEQPREKLNIDKKKLIIYSEIMKPKFLGD
jgi:hypothetical protein